MAGQTTLVVIPTASHAFEKSARNLPGVSVVRAEGLNVPVVVGGIIPEEDAEKLRNAGVARVYTPKDFDLTRIMGEIVDVVHESQAAAA